jgi:superfamily II RNA helicase
MRFYKEQSEATESYLKDNVDKIIKIMMCDGFIQTNEDGTNALTQTGFMATHLREVHCLVFSKLLEKNVFDDLDAKQIVAIFSCFTNVNVSDEQKSFKPLTSDSQVKNVVEEIKILYDHYQDFETENAAFTGVDYNIHYDLLGSVLEWCHCQSVDECKLVLQNLESNKGIFLGEFVKAITKINNITSEMEKIAENIGNIALLSKLREIPRLTLKFVATNQSLYV